MQFVERHQVRNDRVIDDLAFKSKNLYNFVNYILRQCFLGNLSNIKPYRKLLEKVKHPGGVFYRIPEYKLTTFLAQKDQPDYRALPAQVSQQVIKLLYKNWKSFFAANREYHKNPSRFLGRPALPKYKDKVKGRNIVILPNQTVRYHKGYIYFPKSIDHAPIKTDITERSFDQVRIVPRTACYMIEVVYTKRRKLADVDKKRWISGDMGVNNLVTLLNDTGHTFIVNGRPLKSINQYYNKIRAQLQSYVKNRGTSRRIERLTLKRNNKVQDYMHKASRMLVDYCIRNKIGNIVLGYNPFWKQGVNMGPVNNQNFVFIPFLKFLEMVVYKAKRVGIEVVTVEEWYTSKCDSLAFEALESHDEYLGQRVARGLFQSSTGILINADVNGCVNHLRKAVGDSFVKKIVDRGTVAVPMRFTPHQIVS